MPCRVPPSSVSTLRPVPLCLRYPLPAGIPLARSHRVEIHRQRISTKVEGYRIIPKCAGSANEQRGRERGRGKERKIFKNAHLHRGERFVSTKSRVWNEARKKERRGERDAFEIDGFNLFFFFFFLRPSVAIDGREILTPFSPTTSSFSSSSSDSSPRISNRPFITRADASTILGYDSIQMQALFAFFFFWSSIALHIYIYVSSNFSKRFRKMESSSSRARFRLSHRNLPEIDEF